MIEQMGFLKLLVYGLATWRLTSLVVNEEGLFSIFVRLRILAGMRYYSLAEGDFLERKEVLKRHDISSDEHIEVLPMTTLARLLSCVWCASVWVSGLFVAVELLNQQPALQPGTIFSAFVLWLALSTIAILIDTGVSQ